MSCEGNVIVFESTKIVVVCSLVQSDIADLGSCRPSQRVYYVILGSVGWEDGDEMSLAAHGDCLSRNAGGRGRTVSRVLSNDAT